MEGLVNSSDGWEEQLVQLNKIYACLASAKELERTGVGVGGSKRSRLEDHADDSLGEHVGVSKLDVLHDILQNVASLVSLMEGENAFVRHSVKKILIALSDYLILKAQMSSWRSLLHHIWNVLSLESLKGLMVEREKVASTSQPPNLSVNCESKKNWGPVVCGLELLRSILKSCINAGDEHTDVFLGLLEENIHTTVKSTCSQGDSLCSERGLVWSALLQLLCTTIACCDSEDSTSASSELQLLLVEKIGGCIPLFAGVALSPHKHESSSLHCPSSFLRHKVLRLMIGLSRWFETEHILALDCLRALRKEGADLISFSLVENNDPFLDDTNLMRSSFCTSFVHTKEEGGEFFPPSATHLQCRALFLLFRIWSLVATELDPNQGGFQLNSSERNHPEDRKELEDRAPPFSAGIYHHGRTSENSSEKALKEEADAGIREWLQLQSDVVSVENFSMKFLGLYLDEDDLMIEMLLLLVRSRSSLLALVDKTLMSVASALSPLELFQAFLRALSYDHTVLVDFLISQNTGTLFLRYLMLCTGLFTKPKMEHTCEAGSRGLAKESRDCLVQLKAAIERLHRRKLFPYNPSSLLKRLGMLEACRV